MVAGAGGGCLKISHDSQIPPFNTRASKNFKGVVPPQSHRELKEEEGLP